MRLLFSLLLAASCMPALAQQTLTAVNPDDVRKRYVQAVGGETVINSIKDIKLTFSGQVQTATLKYTEWKTQGRLRRDLLVMGRPYQTTVYNPAKKSYSILQEKPQELSETELKKLKRDADIQAVLHPETYGVTRHYYSEERSDSVIYDVLEATDAQENKSLESYDRATGLLMRESIMQPSANGPVNVIYGYSDYREVPGSGGYKIPYKMQQGSATQELEFILDEVVVNQGMAEALFE